MMKKSLTNGCGCNKTIILKKGGAKMIIREHKNLEKEYRHGWKDGHDEGRDEQMLESVRSLMENGFSIEKAFAMLKTPPEVRERVRAALAKS